jgi:hypothetical protein
MSFQQMMAGNGSPWAVLTPLRKQILRALHDGHTADELRNLFELSNEQVHKELAPLAEASLLQTEDDVYLPAFFIADAEEVGRVCEHARAVGSKMGGELLRRWSELENLYAQLSIHSAEPLSTHAFLLIGDLVLDLGLLAALEREGSLLPAPPPRPSPERPDAQYFFWMIEGTFDQVCRYGHRDEELPWDPWRLVSFGQYYIDDVPNEYRNSEFDVARAMASDSRATSPYHLAERIERPIIEEDDAARWVRGISPVTAAVASVYKESEASIRNLYGTLHASSYTPYGFEEFFCWYEHVAYSQTIDFLEAEGALPVPEHRYTMAIWHGRPAGNYMQED